MAWVLEMEARARDPAKVYRGLGSLEPGSLPRDPRQIVTSECIISISQAPVGGMGNGGTLPPKFSSQHELCVIAKDSNYA